ncbi:Putative major facilitator superfamily, MFS transporter superfamily [Septoria linicola]|uniref:Major facilitator superfamily, MFS transporter superfamily n=1 Tax=Septoria linicola TaxID=215465 RepID=A0A9Q9AHP9_9PEZI|nr:Putative major facilitator superfamily, MFS transporter superfamily [Septoria linicola]
MSGKAPHQSLGAEWHDADKSDSDSELNHDRTDSDAHDTNLSSDEKQSNATNSKENEKTGDEKKEDDAKYISGLSLAFLLIAIVSTVFIVALSNTIISTAIPTITSVFNSYSDIGWYTAGEAITATAFQLPFGRAYTLLNTKWTFLTSLIIYLLGSLICAVAQNSVTLIVGRAVAGIGNAGVFSGVFIIISKNVPLRKRALYAGLVGATFAIAAVLGPVLGGIFTDRVSWRWCFWINLPIGAVSIMVILLLLPAKLSKSNKSLKGLTLWQAFLRFNPFGAVVILGAIVSLLLALQWGGGEYSWGDGRVIAVLVVFSILIIGWIALQYFQGDEATVPYSVAKQRSVAGATLFTLLLSASFGIVVYYLPIWYQSVDGNTAEEAGLKQLGIVIALTISGIAGGGLVVKIGYYNPFIYAGTVLCSVGAGLLYTINTDTPRWTIIGYQIIFAAGIGLSLEQCNVAVQTVLPDDKIPAGTSLVLFTRLLGTALSGPIAQSVLQQTLAKRLGNSVAATIYGEGGATGVRGKLDDIFGAGTPALQSALNAFNDSVTRTFMVALILASLTALTLPLIEWKSVKKEKRENEDKKEGRKNKDARDIEEQSEKTVKDAEK